MGEQPHPWPLLQDRDGKSRHRTIDLLLPEVVDYISILFQLKRSRRLIARCYLIGSEENPQSLRGHSTAFTLRISEKILSS
jgi:hypothetical protein